MFAPECQLPNVNFQAPTSTGGYGQQASAGGQASYGSYGQQGYGASSAAGGTNGSSSATASTAATGYGQPGYGQQSKGLISREVHLFSVVAVY